jgi:hypothetical protein
MARGRVATRRVSLHRRDAAPRRFLQRCERCLPMTVSAKSKRFTFVNTDRARLFDVRGSYEMIPRQSLEALKFDNGNLIVKRGRGRPPRDQRLVQEVARHYRSMCRFYNRPSINKGRRLVKKQAIASCEKRFRMKRATVYRYLNDAGIFETI